jgi:hypothetical protein
VLRPTDTAPQRQVSFQGPQEAFLDRHMSGVQLLLRQSVAPSTQARYASAWPRWLTFVHHAIPRAGPSDYVPSSVPTEELTRRLLAFAHYLYEERGASANSVSMTLVGLRHSLQSRLVDAAAFDSSLLSALRTALRRISPPSTRSTGPRLPFVVDMVRQFARYAHQRPTPLNHMTAVGAILGFFNCMRSSEYCVTLRSLHTLRAVDVDFEVSFHRSVTASATVMIPAHLIGSYPLPSFHLRAVRIVQHSAKNIRPGEPQVKWFSALAAVATPFTPPAFDGPVCLVRELHAWACRADFEAPDNYFLSFAGPAERTNLTYQHMLSAVQAVARLYGLDPTRCGTHSLRIGGATAVQATLGSDIAVIQAGNWRSAPVAMQYPRRTSTGNDAQLLALQDSSAVSLRDISMSSAPARSLLMQPTVGPSTRRGSASVLSAASAADLPTHGRWIPGATLSRYISSSGGTESVPWEDTGLPASHHTSDGDLSSISSGVPCSPRTASRRRAGVPP